MRYLAAEILVNEFSVGIELSITSQVSIVAVTALMIHSTLNKFPIPRNSFFPGLSVHYVDSPLDKAPPQIILSQCLSELRPRF